MAENQKTSGASEADKIKQARENLSESGSRSRLEKERQEKQERTPFVNDPRRSRGK